MKTKRTQQRSVQNNLDISVTTVHNSLHNVITTAVIHFIHISVLSTPTKLDSKLINTTYQRLPTQLSCVTSMLTYTLC